MDDPFMDTSRNLARWLQEAGRRGLERAKWPLLVALSACAFLQYFYMNVFLSIDAVRSLIVFVLVNGALPPV